MALSVLRLLTYLASNAAMPCYLAILFGSASYIAVPAAMRLSVPKADPGLYVPMALGLTFPFNVIIGIPLHYAVISAFW